MVWGLGAVGLVAGEVASSSIMWDLLTCVCNSVSQTSSLVCWKAYCAFQKHTKELLVFLENLSSCTFASLLGKIFGTTLEKYFTSCFKSLHYFVCFSIWILKYYPGRYCPWNLCAVTRRTRLVYLSCRHFSLYLTVSKQPFVKVVSLLARKCQWSEAVPLA